MEHDIARLALDAGARQDLGERHAGPFADAAPAFDAIMARDLGARRQRPQIGEGKRELMLDEAVDLEPPRGEFIVGEVEIFVVLRVRRTIGAKLGRDVGLAVFAGETVPAEEETLDAVGERARRAEQRAHARLARQAVAA